MEQPSPSASRRDKSATYNSMQKLEEDSAPLGSHSSCHLRHFLAPYPTIEMMNRRTCEESDTPRKIRYFTSLIIKLDGDIGTKELVLRKGFLCGEPTDIYGTPARDRLAQTSSQPRGRST
jgi:hypothetical protein